MLLSKNEEDFQENFDTLGLDERVVRAIKKLKFKEPTEIQKKAIPLIMTGKFLNKNILRQRHSRLRQDRNRKNSSFSYPLSQQAQRAFKNSRSQGFNYRSYKRIGTPDSKCVERYWEILQLEEHSFSRWIWL